MKAEDIKDLVYPLTRLASAITPNINGADDATGGHVESLTEAVMGVTRGLVQIAEAIERVATAMEG